MSRNVRYDRHAAPVSECSSLEPDETSASRSTGQRSSTGMTVHVRWQAEKAEQRRRSRNSPT